jgi:hypothetical protein
VRVVVHLVRETGGLRRLACIGVLTRDSEGWVRVERGVGFDADGSATPGPAVARLSALLGIEIGDGAEPAPPVSSAVERRWREVLRDTERLLPASAADDDPSRDLDPASEPLGPLVTLVNRIRDAADPGLEEPFVADYGPGPYAVSGGAA